MRSGCWPGPRLLQVADATCSPCPPVWRESRSLGGLNEATNPITGPHPDDLISPSSPPKGPTSKQHHTGVRAST